MATIYKFENSDITNSKSDIICHQVNCQGKMGSGVAKAIKEKFPSAYRMYMQKFEGTGNSSVIFKALMGSVQYVRIPDNERNNWGDQYVANMFAQFYYGYDGKRYTDYDAFYNCLEDIKRFAKEHSIVSSIAFPYRIGCDRGGANWNIILTMIEEVFKDLDIKIEIHSLNKIK